MKKSMMPFLLTLAVLGLCACGSKEPAPTEAATVETQPTVHDPVDDKVLKVLAIGNSFSVDTTHYLADIARAEGFETVIIGNLYIGGCKLQTHAQNAKENLPAYKFYMNYDGEWKTLPDCSLEYALKDQDWDIITMQQASAYSGDAGSFEPYLTELIAYVNENKTNPNARLAWNMTWAYQQDFEKASFDRYARDQKTMYDAILQALEKRVLTHNEFSYIMPCGTAIQNARTSYVGDTLTRDGYHMSELGRVITAYTWLATFTGEPLTEINFTNVSEKLTLTEQDKAMIIEAVNAAIAQPYAVTQSTHIEKTK